MDIHQHLNVSIITPQYFSHITVSVSFSWGLGHTLHICDNPTSIFFFSVKSPCRSWGKEIVHLQFLATSFYFLNQFCHRHALLASVVPCTVCFSLSILSCHKWCSVVGIFFCWKCVLGNILFENCRFWRGSTGRCSEQL
jgi:hypothetical protein